MRISGCLLDNSVPCRLTFRENIAGLVLTFGLWAEWHEVKLQYTAVSMLYVPLSMVGVAASKLGPACDRVGFDLFRSSCQKATLGKNPLQLFTRKALSTNLMRFGIDPLFSLYYDPKRWDIY